MLKNDPGGSGVPPKTTVVATTAPTKPLPPPNYEALIKQTPAYRNWLATRGSRLAGLGTTRAQAIRQMILQFGGVPKGYTGVTGDIRSEDIAAAGANQFSTLAGIQRSDAASREAMHRSLAARGMLQSGDLGYGEDQANLARGQAEATATGGVLGGIGTALGEAATGASNIAGEEAPLIAGLLPTVIAQNPAPVPGAGTAPVVTPAATPAVTAAKAAAAPTSFKWGGRTFQTRSVWENYAKNHGINLKQWYRAHPVAAKMLRG